MHEIPPNTGVLALDDYDPDEGLAYISEIMADDDVADPLLDSYQASTSSGEADEVPR